MRKKHKVRVILVVLIAIIIVSIAISVISLFSGPEETHEIKVSFEVVPNTIGVDLNNTALTFGRVYPGAIITRTVSIYNNYDSPKKVSIFISRNLQDLLFSGKPEFILGSGQKEQVAFTLSIPRDFKSGNYTGEVIFQFR